MGAIVYARQKNYAAETASTLASPAWSEPLRFKVADSPAADFDNPLVRPASSVVRSYEKWIRLYIGLVGPSRSITSPTVYFTGTLQSGVSVYARTTNASSYSTPAVPANDSAGTSVLSYTSSSPKAMDAVNAGPFSGTNTDFGDYLVLWVTIAAGCWVTSRQTPIMPCITARYSWSET